MIKFTICGKGHDRKHCNSNSDNAKWFLQFVTSLCDHYLRDWFNENVVFITGLEYIAKICLFYGFKYEYLPKQKEGFDFDRLKNLISNTDCYIELPKSGNGTRIERMVCQENNTKIIRDKDWFNAYNEAILIIDRKH